jgi:hypothetical protein
MFESSTTQEYDVDQELSMSHGEAFLSLSQFDEIPNKVAEEVLNSQPDEFDIEGLCRELEERPLKDETQDADWLPDAIKESMQTCVRSINEVLGPKHFRSSWRLKWEKKNQSKSRTKKTVGITCFGGTAPPEIVKRIDDLSRKYDSKRKDSLTTNNVRPNWSAKKPKVDPFPKHIPEV